MIAITWELTRHPPGELELGDVTVDLDGATVSSKARHPDQSFMVAATIGSFLDDVLEGLASRAQRPRRPFSLRLEAVDSSFAVRFACDHRELVTVRGPEGDVGTAPLDDVLGAISASVAHFVDAHAGALARVEPDWERLVALQGELAQRLRTGRQP